VVGKTLKRDPNFLEDNWIPVRDELAGEIAKRKSVRG